MTTNTLLASYTIEKITSTSANTESNCHTLLLLLWSYPWYIIEFISTCLHATTSTFHQVWHG